MFIKASTLSATLLSVIGTFTVANPSQAALIDLSIWNQLGDVNSPSLGQANLSTNALQDDDFPAADSNFNFSNNPAIDSPTLEFNLGLPTESLDPDPVNFIFAFEGSGLQQKYTFLQETQLVFDWTFLTNDLTQNINGFDFDDYAFISIDDQVFILASTNNSISNLIPSSTDFSREISDTYTQIFNPGTYSIALGVVDVGNNNNTSALIISNAQILNNQQVPESSSLLALLVPVSVVIISSQSLKFYR